MRFVPPLIQLPAVVGYHQFAFIDQPATGTSTGGNSNWGLVHMDGDAYSLVVTALTHLNRNATAAHSDGKP